jgi:hypothetical protein
MNKAALVATAAVAALSLVACGDSTTEASANLFNDSTTTVDIASSSGDAIATSVMKDFADNEASVGIAPGADFAGDAPSGPNTTAGTANRQKTCWDASNVIVNNCTPLSSVRKIAVALTFDATRSNTTSTTGGNSATWTGSVHRAANDTIVRVFTQTTETSRIHNGNSTAHDTTTFTGPLTTRKMVEVAHDSVKAITFNLPRSTNPYPVSGSVVRVDSVHVEVTATNKSTTKDLVRNVEIDFPADAQGNVVLKVNLKTCNLNLVTHSVTNCH